MIGWWLVYGVNWIIIQVAFILFILFLEIILVGNIQCGNSVPHTATTVAFSSVMILLLYGVQ